MAQRIPDRYCRGSAVSDPGVGLPLDQVAEGYRAMDERRAIKTPLRP